VTTATVLHHARLLTLVICYIGAGRAQQSPASGDPWAPVRFLSGKWTGDVEGEPGKGKSEREYRFVLNDAYIEVRNKSTYAPSPKNPKGEVHEDWGVISFDKSRKKLVLRQFHIERFVNQYVQEAADDGALRFTSEAIENIASGYRAREIYRVTGPDTFIERFEIAAPGKDFEIYSETRFQRAAGDQAAETKRERDLRMPDIVQALALKQDARVADIGAGDGDYEPMLSRAVGKDGRVYAEDIGPNALKNLRERVKTASLQNVDVIEGVADDPKVPAGLDAVLMVITYHEFADPQKVLEHVAASLKPGGRLVVVDMAPHKTAGRPRADQVKNHVIAADLVLSEVRRAGFEVVSHDDHFIDRADEESTRWMIVFRK
jgi:predicted methyltransferase